MIATMVGLPKLIAPGESVTLELKKSTAEKVRAHRSLLTETLHPTDWQVIE